MRTKAIILIAVFLLTTVWFYPANNAFAYWMWTPKTGKWINPKYAPKDNPQDQYAAAMGYYNKKQYDQAIRDFRNLVQYYPRAKESSEGQFYIGVCYEKMGYYWQAFEAYQKTIDEYTYTTRFKEIIARQYRLGELFLGGAKIKYWKVALFPAHEKAIEIFKKVVENDPYSKYADSAQYNLGEAYKKSGLYQDATLAFIKLINDYPDSNLVPNAKFQVAYCSLKGSQGPGYDEQTTDKAIKEFEDYLAAKPNSEFSGDAKEALVLLKDVKAKGLYDVAQFYDKLNQISAAAVYYQEILDLYPESSWAPLSLKRMRIIKAALGEEWEEPELPKTSQAALSKKVLEQKLEALRPQKPVVMTPVIEEPTSLKTQEQVPQVVQATQTMQDKKAQEKQIVFTNPVILKEISCENAPGVGKIWLLLDKSISFSHSYLESPPKIYFKPIENVCTKADQLVKMEAGIIKSITIIKSDAQLPENLKDHYPISSFIIEASAPVRYTVVPQGDKVLITVEKKAK